MGLRVLGTRVRKRLPLPFWGCVSGGFLYRYSFVSFAYSEHDPLHHFVWTYSITPTVAETGRHWNLRSWFPLSLTVVVVLRWRSSFAISISPPRSYPTYIPYSTIVVTCLHNLEQAGSAAALFFQRSNSCDIHRKRYCWSGNLSSFPFAVNEAADNGTAL